MKLGGHESIVVLTGAGISKESGIETFRDGAGGTWAKHRIEDVCTPQALARNRELVLGFYNARRRELQNGVIAPNAAHLALARLEKAWPGPFMLVTQNVDDLHERAGSTKLTHMHGAMLEARCEQCAAVQRQTGDITVADACPACGAVGRMRPHIVFFEEMPFAMDEIMRALDKCTLFISIGTSGNVYPAAGFVERVQRQAYHGWRSGPPRDDSDRPGQTRREVHTVELNLEPSLGASKFAECIYGPATQVVPAYVARLLAEAGLVAPGGPHD